VRDAADKLVRRSYWLDMTDKTLVLVMTGGIGANLTNDEKRARLTDLRREYLIDQFCPQEILPPEKSYHGPSSALATSPPKSCKSIAISA
jgi:hypothetical protein